MVTRVLRLSRAVESPVLASLIVGLCVILLAGCSNDGDEKSANGPASATPTVESTTTGIDVAEPESTDPPDEPKPIEVDPLDLMHQRLFDQVEFNGLESLSETERMLYMVLEFRYDLTDGGLEYYFFNRGAEHVLETVAALRRLEMTEEADQLQRVCEMFPNKTPATEIEERHRQLDALTAEQRAEMEKVSDEIIQQLATARESIRDYLSKHAEAGVLESDVEDAVEASNPGTSTEP